MQVITIYSESKELIVGILAQFLHFKMAIASLQLYEPLRPFARL